ncbi:MAG: hypothetical protein AAF138_11595, partial [Planctomycetota bacterium]
ATISGTFVTSLSLMRVPRASTTSGMPFRRIIEAGLASELHVFGLHTLSADREQMRYYQSHGGRADGFGPDDPWPERPT